MKRTSARVLILFLLLPCCARYASAWDYTYHRLINLAALQSLPTNAPAFLMSTAAVERIGFLAGEPDRWRNVQDLSFSHCSAPDHYLDMEQLDDYGLKAEALPVFRYEFAAELISFRKAHPDKLPAIDPERNKDHTRELIGFVPWAIAENYGKLKSNFAYLKTYEQHGGTPEEIANAQQNIIYVMGTMGHYVGDAGQPLHTTKHHHGWVGDNPKGYTTESRIHSWIDSGYLNKVGGVDLKELTGKMRPAQLVTIDGRTAKPEEMFQATMLFLIGQNKLVETVYEMDKDGRLSGEGEKGKEGKPFLVAQMVKSAQLLGDIWYSAWQQAPPDTFLQRQLVRRNGGGGDTGSR